MRILFLLLALPCFADDYYRQVVLQTPGIVSYWRLGESSGNFVDLKGGNTATASGGGITYSSAGAILEDSNTSVTLNGSTGYGAVANRTPFAFEYNQPFSIEAWVYRAASGFFDIASKMSSSAPFTGYALSNDNNAIAFFLINTFAGNKYIKVTASTSTPLNTWQHIVVTYTGSGLGSGVAIYADGALVFSTVSNDTLASSSILNNNDFAIGARGGGSGSFFNGRVDEVAVYSGVMSAADVLLHYRYGANFIRRDTRSTSSNLNVIVDNDSAVDIDNFFQSQEFSRLAQLGYFKLLAYVNSDSTTEGVVCADYLMRYSGLSPRIGAYKGSDAQSSDNTNCAAYVALRQPGATRANYDDDVTVYREVLSAAANGSVTLIVAASAVSLYNLMTTAGSPSGIQLLTDKVAKVYWVAGIYPTGAEFNFGGGAGSPPGAYRTTANYVLANWPATVPIDFVGIEQGDPIVVNTSANKYSRPNGSPFNTLSYTSRSDWGSQANWASSLTSYYSSTGHANGTNTVVALTGVNTWTSTPNVLMSYLTKTQSDSEYIALGNYMLTYPSHPWGATW